MTEPAPPPPNVVFARRVLIGITVLYGLWVLWSVAVVIDPKGIGGIEEPMGLEYIGLVLAFFVLPFYAAIAGTIWKFVLKPDRERRRR